MNLQLTISQEKQQTRFWINPPVKNALPANKQQIQDWDSGTGLAPDFRVQNLEVPSAIFSITLNDALLSWSFFTQLKSF